MAELERAIYATSIGQFKATLLERMRLLSKELGRSDFSMAVALVLALSPDEGGDQHAGEMVKRFCLLDLQSKSAIDFYFLGWRSVPLTGGGTKPAFELDAFSNCVDRLRQAGVNAFRGNLDLVLCDAHFANSHVIIRFSEAICLDLSRFVASSKVFDLGSFLQALISAAEQARADPDVSPTVQISDRLGITVAGKSLLTFIFRKWGDYVGAEDLSKLATRNVGPDIELARF